MDKVKIAHILHSVGGVDVSLRLILESIDPYNFESIVIHGIDDTKSAFKDKNGNVILEFKLPLQRSINPLKDISCIISTIRILKKNRPDVIHGHSAKGGIVSKLVGNYLNIPVLHTPQAYSYLSTPNKKIRRFYLFIERLMAFKGSKILASSNSERDRAINEVGYPSHRALLFNNSIQPINEIKPLSIEQTWPKQYICSVGRPSYQKNIELMLDILGNLKNKKNDIHLVLMGVGFHSPNLLEVKKKIEKLNLQNNITLLDWTKREDIFNIINNSFLYISTARYEGLPYSIIESLALGKPIVATDADGNRDLIKENYNGYIIKNEDGMEFSRAVFNLINDKEKLDKFSKNSLEFFENEFNMNKNIRKLEDIYMENIKHFK